jgi:hypothetical protein
MISTSVERPSVVELHLTDVPACDLPLALVHDVVTVLRSHGLDPDLLDLSTALYGVITSTPVARGGSLGGVDPMSGRITQSATVPR